MVGGAQVGVGAEEVGGALDGGVDPGGVGCLEAGQDLAQAGGVIVAGAGEPDPGQAPGLGQVLLSRGGVRLDDRGLGDREQPAG